VRYLTVVYRLPDDVPASLFTESEYMSACSWSHAMDDRDFYKRKVEQYEQGDIANEQRT
jgi:hypothetical protein